MKIRYLGHSCFQLTLESGVKIITDPYQGVGYELPKNLRADIVTVSHDHFDHNYVQAVGGSPEWIQGEGTGECSGVRITGIKTWHDGAQGQVRGKNTVYILECDGLRICHLGDIGETCTQELCEKIGTIDLLLMPIGGTYTIDAQQAFVYAQMLCPKIVIPMHYRPSDGKLDIDGADKFLLQYEEKDILRANGEISLTKEKLERTKGKIVFLERVNGL